MNPIVNVALPIKLSNYYSYYIPDNTSIDNVMFKRVLVNFNGRKIRGYVISEGTYTEKFKIKKIIKVIDNQPVLNKNMIKFAEWISSYYFSGIGEVLSLMVPKGIKPAPDDNFPEKSNHNFTLTEKQGAIYNNIIEDINKGVNRFYLYGITGSGKTEIYIKLIKKTLEKNKTVIFLVPEIALSYQTLERLKKSFGSLCAVLHSNLKGSIRLREYFKLFNNKAKIAIGPRSALFAPLKNIGLIIIDEENESAYKSEESPRFHTRTAAFYLAKQNNAAILLGSATPSIESWYHAKNGFLKLYTLNQRYGKALLPDIQIIDTSKFPTKKNLSLPLVKEINKRLQNKEQIVLLQNRRGFSNFIKCSSCEHIIQCPKCNISLTYHKNKEKLICHHCGYSINLPEKCPECSNDKMLKIGAGTQRIEDEISRTFNFANIMRMDQDSAKKEIHYKDLIDKMDNHEIDILVGTQMIAKGLHFPNIKFVGIVSADLILNIPDYKAAERTFALITQVAGRAGRVGEKGFVMIQTLNPDHYSIISAKESNYEKFYEKEIEFRKMLGMPPFYRLLRLIIRGKDEKKVQEDIQKLFDKISIFNKSTVQILGPAPCLFAKINNNYRYQILLKKDKIEPMQMLVKHILNDFSVNNKNYLEIDVDPSGLL